MELDHQLAESLGKPYVGGVLSVLATFNLVDLSNVTDAHRQACAEVVGMRMMSLRQDTMDMTNTKRLSAIANALSDICEGMETHMAELDRVTQDVEVVMDSIVAPELHVNHGVHDGVKR